MKFNSIDSTLDSNSIIKELKKIQASLHPEVNPNYSDLDQEKFLLIEEAKLFLRENSGQALVPISDIVELLKTVKGEEITIQKEIDIIADKFNKSSGTIIKAIKRRHLTCKITATSIWTIITLLWAFPSVIIEHPILGRLAISEGLFLSLSLVWLVSLLAMLIVLFLTHRSERYTKSILRFLENIDNQYLLFSDFISFSIYINDDSKTFTRKNLEEYLYNEIRYGNNVFRNYEYKRLPTHLFYRIKEIIPQMSDMIIAHALEKGVITKISEASWYDTYLVNTQLQM